MQTEFTLGNVKDAVLLIGLGQACGILGKRDQNSES